HARVRVRAPRGLQSRGVAPAATQAKQITLSSAEAAPFKQQRQMVQQTKPLATLNFGALSNRRSRRQRSTVFVACGSWQIGRQVVSRARYMNIEQEPTRNLTSEECEELSALLLEEAAALPPGQNQLDILKLAHGY